jgi:hypothetical protein
MMLPLKQAATRHSYDEVNLPHDCSDTRVRSLCGTMEFGSRLDIVHYLPHQRFLLLSDRDQHNVVDRSYGAGGIQDREFNAAVTMLLNDEIAEQHRADRIVGSDDPVCHR